jgi:hypothetical protein
MSPSTYACIPASVVHLPGGARRIARWRGSPRRRAAVPLDPDMPTFGNWHIRTLHVIADMKGDDSPDRFPSVRDEAAITARASAVDELSVAWQSNR